MTQTRNNRTWFPLLLLAIVSIAIQLPFLHLGFSELDEGSILTISEGISKGDRLYTDHPSAIAPLTYEVLGLAFRISGPSVEYARWIEAAIFISLVLVLFQLVKQVASQRVAMLASLGVLAVKPLGFPAWTVLSYSSLALLLATASVAAVFRALGPHGQPTRTTNWNWALAGFAVALTGLAKQNLGAIAAFTSIGALAVWSLRARPEGDPKPVRALAALICGAAIPLALVGAYFLLRGSAADLVHQAGLGLLEIPDAYRLGLPPLLPWSDSDPELADLWFAYLPSGLMQLIIEGQADRSSVLIPLAELGVKLAYLIPPFAIAFGLVRITFRLRRDTPTPPTAQFALLLFAALLYLSILYRADWTHLMNVYPVILAASVVAWQELSGASGTLRRALGLGFIFFWVVSGVGSGAAVLSANVATISTPRGDLQASPNAARRANSILQWRAEHDPAERVAFLPANPIFYFLSETSVPISHDLLIPAIAHSRDDLELTRQVGSVDAVVYDLRPVPFVRWPLTRFLPALSRELARQFRVDRMLYPYTPLLRPIRPRTVAEPVIVDFWEQLQEAPSIDGERSRTDSWAYYRVLTGTSRRRGLGTCTPLEHRVSRGDQLIALPIFHPKLWLQKGKKKSKRARGKIRFSIVGLRKDGQVVSFYDRRLPPGPPREPVVLDLAEHSPGSIRLLLCAQRRSGQAESGPISDAAWAEVRVVRSPDFPPPARVESHTR